MPTVLAPDAPAAARAWPPPPPSMALTCPKCGAPAQARPEAQRCTCGLRFVLRAGPLLDPALELPAPAPESVSVKSSGFLLRRYAALESDGIVEGALDPVTGHIPMTTERLSYRAIYSVAVWRRIPIATTLLLFLIPVPMLASAIVATIASADLAVALFFLVPMAALTAWVAWVAFGIRANWARVVSTKGELRIRFDSPARRRLRFHQELLRRCGITPSPIP